MANKDSKPPGDERDGDVFAVRAMVTREQALELIGRAEFDFGDRPHWTEGPDRTGRLDLFVSRAQLTQLEGEGVRIEVDSNQSARARERLAEVGEGDRFEGGRIPPRGLGRKIGGRGRPGADGQPSGGSERGS
jgi:hypothetical protein